jgi:hypothetical protein
MTTTEHATRRPLRRIESSPGHVGGLPAAEDVPAGAAGYEAGDPDQLETLCVGEAR